jgi:transcriptional regulator GlxA family with amidase domain
MPQMRAGRGDPKEIGILMYPGVQLSAALGLTDIFIFADKLSRGRLKHDKPLLRVSQLAANGVLERLSDTAPEYAGTPDVILLPPCLITPSTDAFRGELVAWLRAEHAAGVTLASVCGGGFLLAQTGLIEGRSATTNYNLGTLYAERFPDVVLDMGKMMIDHGDIITSGGLLSWTDLGLRFVERMLGRAAMVQTARYLVIDIPSREQCYNHVFAPNLAHDDEAILEVQDWLSKSEWHDVNTAVMAKRAHLEERTFLRRFRKATGLTPMAYFQQLRISRALELLEATAKSVSAVAWEVGYDDPRSFRKTFTKIVGRTPQEHRRLFGAYLHHEKVGK